MKNIKCIIGFHSYEFKGTQKAQNIINSFSLIQPIREVYVCACCGKTKFFGLDISSNIHLNQALKWL